MFSANSAEFCTIVNTLQQILKVDFLNNTGMNGEAGMKNSCKIV